jgi:hypothetical protein
MGLKDFFIGLPGELALVAPRYEVQHLAHAVLASYGSLDALFAETEPKKKGKKTVISPEGSAILVALVELHAKTHDRLWGALLLRTFRPMLEKVAKHLRGGSRDDREAVLLMSFHEALLRVDPLRDPVRIAMYVRQETRRRAFRALGDELEWQGVGFGMDADLCADPKSPEPRLFGRPWTARNALAYATAHHLLDTAVDRGALWSLVRKEHGSLPAKEQARIYRRLQKRRGRIVGRLRDRLLQERRSTRAGVTPKSNAVAGEVCS